MLDTYIFTFLLILVRVTAFFVTSPVFSSKTIPRNYKLGLSFFIALIIYPTIIINLNSPITEKNFIFFLIQETILGLTLGWIANILFTSIQVAGSFIDMQIGFAIANVIDPQTGIQSPLLGNFKYTFAILLFLTINGHHLFIDGIVSSYDILPLTGDWLKHINDEQILMFILSTFTEMFVMAFKMAAPIVATLFLSDIVLGIAARTVPQLNVFVVGLPLKIFISFLIIFLIAPGFIYLFKDLFQEMFTSVRHFIELME